MQPPSAHQVSHVDGKKDEGNQSSPAAGGDAQQEDEGQAGDENASSPLFSVSQPCQMDAMPGAFKGKHAHEL